MSGKITGPSTEGIDYRTIDIRMVLDAVPDTWSVENKDGRIRIPSHGESGIALAEYLATHANHLEQRFTPEQAAAIAARLDAYVGELNAQTVALRATTTVTSRPLLAMRGEPDVFLGKLSAHALKNHLEASGAVVVDLSAKLNGDDEGRNNWTRDHYVLAPNGSAIAMRMKEGSGPILQGRRFEEHNRAVATTVEALKALGVPVKEMVNGAFQSGDVLQHPGSNTVFVGISVNHYGDDVGKMNAKQLVAADELAQKLGMKLVAVPKTQGTTYYHLDTFMSVLPDGSVVLLPDATTQEAKQAIRGAIKGHGEMLELPIREGESSYTANVRRDVATNIITVNGNSFTANAVPEMRDFLAARGLKLIEGPYGWGQSGPHCQVNLIERGKADGRSDIASLVPEGLGKLAYVNIDQASGGFNPNPVFDPGIKPPKQLG